MGWNGSRRSLLAWTLACGLLAGCGGEEGGGTLVLDLNLPESGNLLSYGGGLTLIPVELSTEDGREVDLSVSTDAEISAEVVPTRLTGPGVFEVFLRPSLAANDRQLDFEVRASASGLEAAEAGGLTVMTWDDSEQAYADQLLAIFLPYLEANHPELGLGPGTTWLESWNPQPVLVVTHRGYLSEGWELHLAWHNTIPPHDWSYLTLRRRTAFAPELGFCFPSQTDDHAIQQADLSDPRLPCAE